MTEIIPGRKPVREYLDSIDSATGIELFVAQSAHGKIIDEIVAVAARKGIKAQFCDKDFFSTLMQSSQHQGVILRLHQKRDSVSDHDFFIQVKQKRGVMVLLDQITDPYNAGSIIRSTEALGGDAVVIHKAHSVDITPVVIKASAGATAHLRILRVPSVATFLESMKKEGFWIIGTSLDGDTDIEKLRDLRPAVLVIGSEGSGMRRLTTELCDHLVAIPLRGRMESLNASVAAGIILYEMFRD